MLKVNVVKRRSKGKIVEENQYQYAVEPNASMDAEVDKLEKMHNVTAIQVTCGKREVSLEKLPALQAGELEWTIVMERQKKKKPTLETNVEAAGNFSAVRVAEDVIPRNHLKRLPVASAKPSSLLEAGQNSTANDKPKKTAGKRGRPLKSSVGRHPGRPAKRPLETTEDSIRPIAKIRLSQSQLRVPSKQDYSKPQEFDENESRSDRGGIKDGAVRLPASNAPTSAGVMEIMSNTPPRFLLPPFSRQNEASQPHVASATPTATKSVEVLERSVAILSQQVEYLAQQIDLQSSRLEAQSTWIDAQALRIKTKSITIDRLEKDVAVLTEALVPGYIVDLCCEALELVLGTDGTLVNTPANERFKSLALSASAQASFDKIFGSLSDFSANANELLDSRVTAAYAPALGPFKRQVERLIQFIEMRPLLKQDCIFPYLVLSQFSSLYEWFNDFRTFKNLRFYSNS